MSFDTAFPYQGVAALRLPLHRNLCWIALLLPNAETIYPFVFTQDRHACCAVAVHLLTIAIVAGRQCDKLYGSGGFPCSGAVALIQKAVRPLQSA